MSNNSIDRFASLADYSWVKQLKPDPETERYAPNKSSREVKSGHYVLVKPTPLPQPRLVSVSRILLDELGLKEDDCKNDPRFTRFFSGDVDALKDKGFTYSWATPYALAIYGTDYYQNCPFGTGNGYGDGRAISVAEVVIPETGKRWEFQLKGAGKTPFCRGGDGRAVLRSSVREFLVSEAMHRLGVSTTRALSLVLSNEEKVVRPWYSTSQRSMPDLDLDSVPAQFAQFLRAQMFQRSAEPDVMVSNPAAITCRVAPSFIRVGHIQLFERRARRDPKRLPELRAIVEHAMFREFPDIHSSSSSSFEEKCVQMILEASKRIAKLTADWVRVGFCQGNFNSDNCLVAGRTMDYGPFGYIERFQPLWNMWSGGGEHFGFLNQPVAGAKNFGSLCRAVEPLLMSDEYHDHLTRLRKIAAGHEERAQQALSDVWRQKLGLTRWIDGSTKLVPEMLRMMERTEADYTKFFRQLAHCAQRYVGQSLPDHDDDEANKRMIEPLSECFYAQVGCKSQAMLVDWIRQWLEALNADAKDSQRSPDDIATAMRLVSPKYVAREWMLVKAYTSAYSGDYQLLEQLYNLLMNPYDEQPDMDEEYYKKAPEETYKGSGKGGTAFMT